MHEKEVEFFSGPPTFVALVSKCREKFGWPLSMRGRFDCGKEQSHYLLMPLSCEDEWKDYIDVVKSSNIRCLEVVVEKGSRPLVVPVDVSVDVEVVENLTQEEELQPSPVREVDKLSDLSAIGDDFNEEGYYDEEAMYDTLSEGSEDDGVAIGNEVEADLTSYDDMSDDLLDDLLKGVEHWSDPSSEDETECREARF
jgi:hypothetical protein